MQEINKEMKESQLAYWNYFQMCEQLDDDLYEMQSTRFGRIRLWIVKLLANRFYYSSLDLLGMHNGRYIAELMKDEVSYSIWEKSQNAG